MDYDTAIAEFRSAMGAAGLVTAEEIVADGKIHRFYVEGDTRGKENGWYILHVDERPAGRFGSWKSLPEGQSWTAKNDRRLTSAERAALEKRISEQKRVLDAELARQHAETAEQAQDLWNRLEHASSHPYLTRKGVKPFGTKEGIGEQCARVLVVPMRDGAGKIWSLQSIYLDGDKKFMWKGRVQGLYFTIAKGPPGETILICEGFATGASLHQATEFPVVVAFNAGNLAAVALTIRKKFPDARLVFCADDDAWTTKPILNPGVHFATEAANLVGGVVAVPDWNDRAVADKNRWSDFNDLAALEGLPRVAEIVEAAILGFNDKLPNIAKQQDQVVPQGEEVGGHGAVAAPKGLALPGRGFKFRILDWPIVDVKGRPSACIENVGHLLEKNDIRVRYDMIRKDLDVRVPGETYLIDTQKNDQMTRIVSICSTAGLPITKVEDFVAHIASQNPYNPVVEWVTSRPWDGESRLTDFYETVVAKGEELTPTAKAFKETLLKRWMISAIAAAFRAEGVSAHGILVFRGDQYLGKTNWFKHLVPQELKLTRDGMLLDPKDKDSVYQIVSNWIVELGELDATFRKADVAQLKSFITKDQDTIRLPYRREPATYARRTVFFGSVNDEEYLSDPTGNRRFWTIDCSFLHHDHNLNMQQIWAEFYALYQGGECWYLTAEEMALLNAHNRSFEVVTPIEELVRARYPWDSKTVTSRLASAAEIASELGFRNPTVRETRAIGKAIREITGQEPSRNNGKRLFRIPEIAATQAALQYPYQD